VIAVSAASGHPGAARATLITMGCAHLGLLIALVTNAYWRAKVKKDAIAPSQMVGNYTIDGHVQHYQYNVPAGNFITILIIDILSI
jgi:hypothetical protein